MIALGPQACGSLAEASSREWLVADGLGGYASGTVASLRTRREPEHPGRRPAGGLDEQPVVAARPQARDGSHRIPAEPVGDEPLAQGGLVEAPAGLRAENDHGATGPVSRSSTSPIVGTSAPPWRRMRSATMPVQPVWWLAPSPAPLSPWKYS